MAAARSLEHLVDFFALGLDSFVEDTDARDFLDWLDFLVNGSSASAIWKGYKILIRNGAIFV